jgi:uncharacterized repeat protein (TIGR02543 family)
MVELMVGVTIIGLMGLGIGVATLKVQRAEKNNRAVDSAQIIDNAKQVFARNTPSAQTQWDATTTDEEKFALLKPWLASTNVPAHFEHATENSYVPKGGYDFTLNGLFDPTTVDYKGETLTGDSSSGTKHLITVNSANDGGGTPVMGSATGGGNYAEGSTIFLFATPREGGQFVKWQLNGGDIAGATNAMLEVTVPASVATYTALFSASGTAGYSLTIKSANPDGGSVSAVKTSGITAGEGVGITATPNTGYVFDGWDGEGITTSASASTTVTVTSSRTVVAKFRKVTNTVTININDSAMGSVDGGGDYATGNTATITATPNTGFRLVDMSINGTQVSTDTVYAFTVSSNTTVDVVFEAIPTVTITIEVVTTDLATSDAGRVLINDTTSTFSTALPNPAVLATQKAGDLTPIRAGITDPEAELFFSHWQPESTTDNLLIQDTTDSNTIIIANQDVKIYCVLGTQSELGLPNSNANIDPEALFSPLVGKPVVINPLSGDNDVPVKTTIVSSEFRVFNASDIHIGTDWLIARDSAFTDMFLESLDDSVNLTSYPLSTPFERGATYYAKVRYKASGLGYSKYSDTVTFTATTDKNNWGTGELGNATIVTDTYLTHPNGSSKSNQDALIYQYKNLTVEGGARLTIGEPTKMMGLYAHGGITVNGTGQITTAMSYKATALTAGFYSGDRAYTSYTYARDGSSLGYWTGVEIPQANASTLIAGAMNFSEISSYNEINYTNGGVANHVPTGVVTLYRIKTGGSLDSGTSAIYNGGTLFSTVEANQQALSTEDTGVAIILAKAGDTVLSHYSYSTSAWGHHSNYPSRTDYYYFSGTGNQFYAGNCHPTSSESKFNGSVSMMLIARDGISGGGSIVTKGANSPSAAAHGSWSGSWVYGQTPPSGGGGLTIVHAGTIAGTIVINTSGGLGADGTSAGHSGGGSSIPYMPDGTAGEQVIVTVDK